MILKNLVVTCFIFFVTNTANAADINALKVSKCLLLSAKYSTVSDEAVSGVSQVLSQYYRGQFNLIPVNQQSYFVEQAKNELIQLNTEQQLELSAAVCLQDSGAKQYIRNLKKSKK
jgi:hypothetical protein